MPGKVCSTNIYLYQRAMPVIFGMPGYRGSYGILSGFLWLRPAANVMKEGQRKGTAELALLDHQMRKTGSLQDFNKATPLAHMQCSLTSSLTYSHSPSLSLSHLLTLASLGWRAHTHFVIKLMTRHYGNIVVIM